MGDEKDEEEDAEEDAEEEPPAAEPPALAAAGGGDPRPDDGGSGPISDEGGYWKTFNFTGVKESGEVVGWEARCFIDSHSLEMGASGKRQYCTRTMRWRSGGGREMTERKLKQWCMAGFASGCDSKDLHMQLPKHPDDVPHLHDLEAAPIPAEHMAAWLANPRAGKRAPRS